VIFGFFVCALTLQILRLFTLIIELRNLLQQKAERNSPRCMDLEVGGSVQMFVWELFLQWGGCAFAKLRPSSCVFQRTWKRNIEGEFHSKST
jgi:hypothetical protein